jgi:heat shock protein HslJ
MKQWARGLALMGLLLAVAACGATGGEAATPTTLTDVKWRLTEMRTGGQVTTISQPDRYTVTFSSQGRLNYKADCNNGNGTYKQSGDQLNIILEPIALQNCGPDSLAATYYRSLNDVATYSIKSEVLHLNLAQKGDELVHGK